MVPSARMGGGARRLGIGVIAFGAFTVTAACYPTFQFDGAGGDAARGTGGGSASSGVRPTGGNTTAASNAAATSNATTTTSTTSTTSNGTTTTASATSAGSGMSSAGAPCDVERTMACTGGLVCCFELSVMPTDACAGTCEIDQDGDLFRDHVSLGCNEDADCGAEVCCIQYTIGGNLRGTYCQASCDPGFEDRACDPLGGGCASGTCASLLADEYGGAQPPPPYDRYGICQ
jgi:hypothetical protein